MKRLELIQNIEGKSHNYSTYKTNILEGNFTFKIVTNKKKGTQDLINVLHTDRGEEFLSYLLEDANNKDVLKYLYNNFKCII